MKSKLLPVILIILVLLNGVLIFMLIKKPHQNQERNFLTEQLGFSENQKMEFRNLDRIHRENMMSFDQQIREHKDVLFNSFADNGINIDSLGVIIGKLEGKKEVEVFSFFKSVRKICNKEQQEKFDQIINKALKGGKERPPREESIPPPPPR